MNLHQRPATPEDTPALFGLVRAWERRWFGEAETSDSELHETFDRADLATQTRVIEDADGQILGGAWFWGSDAAAQLAATPAAYDVLLPWLRSARATEVEALAQDEELLGALERHGWQRWLLQYDLIANAAGIPTETPRWPAGTRVTGLVPERDGRAVHALIHEDAGWSDVPGHVGRTYEEWLPYLVPEGYDPDQQVVLWRGDRPIGAALGRTFADGTGWVWQLAVARTERRYGLGRSLLLAALHKRIEAGAARVGLGVSAGNPDALRLYLSCGLSVDREWVRFRPA